MPEKALATSSQAVTFSGFQDIEDKEYYFRTLIQPLRDDRILDQFFEKRTMPKNHGKTMTFRKSQRIKPRTEPLIEGILPEPNEFAISEYSANIMSFGDYITYSDESKTFSIDNIYNELYTEMGYSYKDFIDIKRVELLKTTKNVWFAGGAANSSTVISNAKEGIVLSDLPKIAAFLTRNKVKGGANNYFAFLIPPEALIGLQSLAKSSTEFTFVEINNQQRVDYVYTGEAGKLFRFSFIPCESLHINEDKTCDCFILGKVRGRWGACEIGLEGNSYQMISKGLESGGVENALNQVGSVGWKLEGYGGIVEEDAAVIRYVAYISSGEYAEIANKDKSGFNQEVSFTPRSTIPQIVETTRPEAASAEAGVIYLNEGKYYVVNDEKNAYIELHVSNTDKTAGKGTENGVQKK